MDAEILITIFIWSAFGWLIHSMATNRKRNAVAWTVWGVLTIPLGAVILLLLLGDLVDTENSVDG